MSTSSRFLGIARRPLPVALWLLLGLCSCGDDSPTLESEPSWEEAFDGADAGWLLSVWGPRADDLWAVGGTEEEGVLMHRDEDSWSPVSLPDEVPLLNWVHGFGADDVTAVGNDGSIVHFDGERWREQSTPTEEDLWGVWGAAPDDLWAVGGRGRAEGQATILHFDGDEWTQVEPPELERSGVNAFFKVWGSSARDVLVVGQRGAVLRYDGERWQEELVGASDDLIALWGTGPDHVVVVGGRGIGVVSIWDGDEWNTESLAPTAGLNGVWLRDEETAYVGGINGTLGVLDLGDLSVHQEAIDTTLDLHGVFGVNDELFAVGGNFLGPVPPYEGVAVTRKLVPR